MSRIMKIGLPLTTLILFLSSCMNSMNPIVQSVEVGSGSYVVSGETNRMVMGLWKIYISDDHNSLQVVPLRIPEMHLNAVKMLEVSPCTNCLKISNLKQSSPKLLDMDLTIKHPLSGNLNFTAFDVRAILMTGTDSSIMGRHFALGLDVPHLVNPDGYTVLFNPAEFPESKPGPPALRYIPGKFAPGGWLSADLNPFLAYGKDNPRRMFFPGSEETKHISLYLPDGPLEFGYAIDLCWANPGVIVSDPVADFPVSANCLEAYQISMSVGFGLHNITGSSATVSLEVFDHQGLATISKVIIEAPALFSGAQELSYSTTIGEDNFLFTGGIVNETGAGFGQYPCIIQVTDTQDDLNLGPIAGWDLAMVFIEKNGAAVSWGSDYYHDDNDYGYSLVTDNSNNVYVTGCLESSGDLDPGSGVYTGAYAFVSKFDADLNFLKAVNFTGGAGRGVCIGASGDLYVTGGSSWLKKYSQDLELIWEQSWDADNVYGVAVDDFESLYVIGSFSGTVDFDPGLSWADRTSNGSTDVFVSKFDSTGAFKWVCTWGGSAADEGKSIVVDHDGNICSTGNFRNTVDFDPGLEIDERTTNGEEDIFISKVNNDSTFITVNTFGTSYPEFGNGIAVDINDDILVVGANNSRALLLRYDDLGNLIWQVYWGDSPFGWDVANGISINASGFIVVVGQAYTHSIGGDPTKGLFIRKYGNNNELEWNVVLGAMHYNVAHSAVFSESGYIYWTGRYCQTIDFDPGPGITELSSIGGSGDVFLAKYPPDKIW